MDRAHRIQPARFTGPVLVIALLSALLVLPMYFVGITNGDDLSQHIQFASSYRDSLLLGDPLPGWSANENRGYGSLGVRFYPPLFSLALGLAVLVAQEWHLALVMTLWFFTALGGTGMLLLTSEYLDRRRGLIAAAAFTLLPYHLVEIYSRSLYAEYAGLAILPFLFWSVLRVARTRSLRDTILLAFFLGSLILAHIPMTLIGGVSLLVFAIPSLCRDKWKRAAVLLSLGVALAIGATSFFWIKVLYEYEWLRHTKFSSGPVWDLRESFLLTIPSDRVIEIWFSNLVLLSIISVTACAIWGIRNQARKDKAWGKETGSERTVRSDSGGIGSLRTAFSRQPRETKAFLVLFAFGVLMTTPLSYPVWYVVPLLKEAQFAWRWLAIVVLAASPLVGAGAGHFLSSLKGRFSYRSPPFWLAVITVALLAASFQKLGVRWNRNHIPADSFNEWSIKTEDSTGFEFWWTRKTTPGTFEIVERVTAPGRSIEIIEWKPAKRVFRFDDGPEARARIATLYYPHWKATSNGKQIEVAEGDDGAIEIRVPGGKATVTLAFVEPEYVRMAEWISLGLWVLLLLAGVASLGRHVVRRSMSIERTDAPRKDLGSA